MRTTGVGRRSASALAPGRSASADTPLHLQWHDIVARIDALLAPHATVIGRDYDAYRHHVYRVAMFCRALAPGVPNADEKIAIAAAYHDIGIWTHGTFDYLDPSIDDCRAYLAATGRHAWAPEISAMIREHHKLTRWRAHDDWLVEPFRMADLVDLSGGFVAFGLPRPLRRAVFGQWPSLGFRRRLVQLTLQRLRRHPLSPLPMLRL